MTSQEEAKNLYRRMVEEVVNQGKFDVVEEIFDPSYVDHVAPPGAPAGLEGVKMIFGLFRTGFPDVKFTIDDMVADGDLVATRVHGEGTQTGPFLGNPPSGKHAVWRSVGFFRVANGKIVEHWGIPDLLGLLIQIGVIPEPQAQAGRPSELRQ
jgi:predicted ester cyclase